MSRGKLNAASLLKVSKESESEKVKVMAKCQSNFKLRQARCSRIKFHQKNISKKVRVKIGNNDQCKIATLQDISLYPTEIGAASFSEVSLS